MSASKKSPPKLERFEVHNAHCVSYKHDGKFVYFEEASRVVNSQHLEILRLRTELNRYKSRNKKLNKRLKLIGELDVQS